MASIIDTALRTFDSDIGSLLKGFPIAIVAPLLLLALVGFLIFKVFFADSSYSPYAQKLALTAADVWDRRNELGLSPSIKGRTLNTLEPLTEVLDALTNAVKKYEHKAPNSFSTGSHSKVRFE